MKILWISSLAWNYNGEYEFPVNGPGAVSGSLFQQQIILGLEKLGVEVDIIADYPFLDRDNRKGELFSHNHRTQDYRIRSYKSIYTERLFKSGYIARTVKKRLQKSDYDLAVAYLIHTPYLEALRVVKSYGIKTILICPDLPDMMDMSLSEKKVKRLMKQIDMKIQNYLFKSVDGYVLFTEHMKEKLPVRDKPFVVIEGVASLDYLDISPVTKERAIMHAGTLHKNIGIENIVEAVMKSELPDLRLWIFGDGELKPYILAAAERDSRIEYKGFVDRRRLFDYEKKALALINARNPEDAYTRYSFPSKTFEYLYSGTLYITTKLAGIPHEYDNYLEYIENNHTETILKKINQVYCEENTQDATKVREFLQREKTAIPQVKKLLNLINRI